MRNKMPFELRGFVEVFSEKEHYVGLGSGTDEFGLPKTAVKFDTTAKTKTAITWAEEKLTEVLRASGCKRIEADTYSTIRADHATSTCRLSSDSANGVVDADLKAHGTDNVYVCSNAAIPNGAAVNPTLTLIALAERLAEHLSGCDVSDEQNKSKMA